LVHDAQPRVYATPQFRQHDQSSLLFCCHKFAPPAYSARRAAGNSHAKLNPTPIVNQSHSSIEINFHRVLLFVTPPRSSVSSISLSFTSRHRGTNSRITGLHHKKKRKKKKKNTKNLQVVCEHRCIRTTQCVAMRAMAQWAFWSLSHDALEQSFVGFVCFCEFAIFVKRLWKSE
jgi:hypothetical protein